MTKEKPLYVSIEPEVYKNSKSGILNSQIDILSSMKYLHNLKQLKEEKVQNKKKLFALFASLSEDLDELEGKFPKVEMPRELKEEKKIIPKQISKADLKKQAIEEELTIIKEKLRAINNL